MRTTSIVVAGLLLTLASVTPGIAQEGTQAAGPSPYIDLETDYVTPPKAIAVRTDARLFGGHENLSYVSAAGRLGLGHGLEGILRGTFANKKKLTTGNGLVLRHGGSDFEAALKYHPTGSARVALLAGVSLADTPEQSDAFLTLGGALTHPLSSNVEVTLNPRAIFVDENTIAGVGIGATARLGKGLHVTGEWTPLITGFNTRSVATGAVMHRDVYGVAVHYAPRSGDLDWSAGYTNSTGTTTGFSLTPALGGGGAFFFAVALRR